MKVGVLALQGAVSPHKEKLKSLGAIPVEVRLPSDLVGLSGIILPGGESTTMLHLLKLNRLWEPLKGFVETMPSWGACAGAILLAKEVTSPSQASFGVLSVTVERNAYGRQIDSFIGDLQVTAEGKERLGASTIEGVFIRAPRFTKVGPSVVTLVTRGDESVMVEEGRCLASTFHPELSEANLIHEYFLKKCRNN